MTPSELKELLRTGFVGLATAIHEAARRGSTWAGKTLDVDESNENRLGFMGPIAVNTAGLVSTVTPLFQALSKEPRKNPQTLTVSFRTPSSNASSKNELLTGVVIPRGVIRWGSGGNNNEVTVDIIKGVQVTVQGTSIEVFAFADVFVSPETEPSVFVGGDVSYGNRAGSGVAPCFTRLFFNITTSAESGFGTGLIPVPNFAKDVTVMGIMHTGLGPLTADVWFIGDTGGDNLAIYSTYTGAFAPAAPVTVPIPGGTQFINVSPQNGGDKKADSITVRFGLSI